jgi:hypothetical protein
MTMIIITMEKNKTHSNLMKRLKIMMIKNKFTNSFKNSTSILIMSSIIKLMKVNKNR